MSNKNIMTRASMDLVEDNKTSLGMLVALISWGMLFATLFLAYAVYRASQPNWPPIGMPRVPLIYPCISTGIILMSSLFYHLYSSSAQILDREKMKNHYIMLIAMALGFLAVQIIFWKNLKTIGVYASSGIFGSLVYGLTWIHAAHILLGLLGIVWLAPLTFRANKDLSKREFNWILNVGKFWHFLGVIWIIMFLTIFVF